MFSYRHAFHAGNHADVLKHATLIAILSHMLEKEAALMVVDTHAGAGLYRLDGDYAQTSGESVDGIKKLLAAKNTKPKQAASSSAASKNKTTAGVHGIELAPLLQNYVSLVA